jgi:crossover junction endodeoxyribonuclease RusA
MARKPTARDRTDDTRPPLLEFCVHGQPVSAQGHNRARLAAWRQRIRVAATAAWPVGRRAIEVAVELRIAHYAEARVADMDNLIKPIQDALQGIAYVNDNVVQDVTGSWRNINGRFPVRYMPLTLAAAFSDGREFVHVCLWLAPREEELG